MKWKCPHCKEGIDKIDLQRQTTKTKGKVLVASCQSCSTILNVIK